MKRCQMIGYMITLAIVTPIGWGSYHANLFAGVAIWFNVTFFSISRMIIGIILTIHVDTESASQTLVIGILQGIAGGTLLYVTFYEVLERDKLEKIGMTGLLGCFLIVLGFGLMAGLEAAGRYKFTSKL